MLNGLFLLSIFLSSSAEIDSRIHNLIEDIGNEVHYYDKGSQYNCSTHDHGIISVDDGLDKGSSDSRNSEDLLHHKAACNDICKHRTHICNYRYQGILKCMAEDDLCRSHALCPGGTDIILSKDIQHT